MITRVSVSVLRGVLLLASGYFLLGYLSFFAYDLGLFDAKTLFWLFARSYHLWLGVLFLLSYLLISKVYRTGDTRSKRYFVGTLGFLLVGAMVFIVYLWYSLPWRCTNGICLHPPNSVFHFDQLSIRPTITVRTNSLGLRDIENDTKNFSGFRVLVVGDSIVFGSGIVENEQTLTYRLRDILTKEGNFVVMNVSMNGLNFEQEVALLEHFAPILKPNLVVLVHNPENDFMPVLPYYAHPLLSMVFVWAMTEYEDAIAYFREYTKLSRLPGVLDAYASTINKLGELAETHDFHCLFVYLWETCPPPYFRAPQKGADRFVFANLPTLLKDSSLRFTPLDFHPNPRGVEAMARDLAPIVLRTYNALKDEEGKMFREYAKEYLDKCVARKQEPPELAKVTATRPKVTERVKVGSVITEAGARMIMRELQDAVTLESMSVTADRVLARVLVGKKAVEVTLFRRDSAGSARLQTKQFSIVLDHEPDHEELELLERMRSALERLDNKDVFEDVFANCEIEQ
jgi:hypothetical protein